MESKTEMRFFFLPDFEKEEKYLAKQHRQGWKLIQNYLGFLFVFEKYQPEEVVYQLDFKPKGQDKSEYIQMFADYGWDYIGDCNHFSYFRKNQSLGEVEIYSDLQSKLEMIGRIIGGQFLLGLFLLILFTLLFYFLKMPAAIFSMTTITVPILLYCLVGLLRLRKKYKEVGK